MSHHQMQTPPVDGPDEPITVQDENSDGNHFVATSWAAGYEVSPEAEIAQEVDFALATDQPHEAMLPGTENFFDETADFFDLVWASDPIWNDAEMENDSAWCLEPRVDVTETIEASSSGSQNSFVKLRSLLDQRKAQREAAKGADIDLPILSEEDYVNLYPKGCTQEQWDQLIAEYSMVDVGDIMLAHLEYTAKIMIQSEATAATES
ncbi:hypothetical protein E4U17_006488 [Claviceps sp. LM77 group G4]|nr:hypothetical protein E4U17_006488 [Claviceps sp. LM77 group G4]KAG6054946.1 hypothetical protein E4U33_008007 [Claviceps sp. LM78 group G4]KAG6069528.1 hypothetical protein E4U16_007642 [Claviceps sp. LM84 group G4]